MKKLSYATLEKMGYEGYLLKDAPERVLQFGEGNFLRAFVECWIDKMNEKAGFNSKVVLCQPIAPGLADMINEQEGLYTLLLRGNENGKKVDDRRVISCVSRCLNPYKDYDAVLAYAESEDIRFVVCNTTEAGIQYDPSCQFADVPAASYPAGSGRKSASHARFCARPRISFLTKLLPAWIRTVNRKSGTASMTWLRPAP